MEVTSAPDCNLVKADGTYGHLVWTGRKERPRSMWSCRTTGHMGYLPMDLATVAGGITNRLHIPYTQPSKLW